MTDTTDELERAIERLKGDLSEGEGPFVVVYNDDVQLLLSERAELLATVEKMRELLRCIVETHSSEFDAVLMADRIRAELTTGEEK